MFKFYADKSVGCTSLPWFVHPPQLLLTPHQFEIISSRLRHNIIFGEFGSGKTVLLLERARQLAWEAHHAKTQTTIFLLRWRFEYIEC